MQRLTEILVTNMGGYAIYVWSAYLLAAFVMAIMAVLSWRDLRHARQRLKQLQTAASDEA